MTNSVKRPAPIQERYETEIPLRRTLVHLRRGMWRVSWGYFAGKDFATFPEAIRFATQDREIGACS